MAKRLMVVFADLPTSVNEVSSGGFESLIDAVPSPDGRTCYAVFAVGS
jgi:hypothetical protein